MVRILDCKDYVIIKSGYRWGDVFIVVMGGIVFFVGI